MALKIHLSNESKLGPFVFFSKHNAIVATYLVHCATFDILGDFLATIDTLCTLDVQMISVLLFQRRDGDPALFRNPTRMRPI